MVTQIFLIKIYTNQLKKINHKKIILKASKIAQISQNQLKIIKIIKHNIKYRERDLKIFQKKKLIQLINSYNFGKISKFLVYSYELRI